MIDAIFTNIDDIISRLYLGPHRPGRHYYFYLTPLSPAAGTMIVRLKMIFISRCSRRRFRFAWCGQYSTPEVLFSLRHGHVYRLYFDTAMARRIRGVELYLRNN